MISLWNDHISLPQFKQLEGEHTTDVLIIGAGMAGILCAHFLQQEGIDYILVEGKTIGSGITGNTTAKITSQHRLIYDKLIRKSGQEQAQMYYRANEEALNKYADMCSHIDCDFEQRPAYVYSKDNQKVIEKELHAALKLGIPASFSGEIQLPFPIAGAVKFPDQGQFHPLKFLREVADGKNIYEGTRVVDLIENHAVTDHGKIRAKRIIVTTHFPFINRHGSYFLKMYQHRSYVIGLKTGQDIEGMYIEDKQDGLSFRNYQDLLLIGGGAHRTGKQGGSYDNLRQFAASHYKEAKEVCHFAAQDCMTLDGLPYIGHYAKSTPDLYVATGFQKWGMSLSMVGAMMLRDMMIGKRNEYEELFSPSRGMLKPQLFINSAEAILNFLSFTGKRCPHLGCALKWNPVERTWDCPCHGSRFSRDGELIDNPATGDMK